LLREYKNIIFILSFFFVVVFCMTWV
jgi:hypothetical protein